MESDSPFSNRLDTNYVPTPSELEIIEGLIDARQVVVDGIDKKIAELDRLRKELEADRDVQHQYIVKHRRLTTIVRRLPDDILSTLFLTWLSLSLREGSTPPSITITHVCRHWRSLALNMPLLWRHINLSLATLHSYHEKWVDQWFKHLLNVDLRTSWFVAHAGACPLELSLTAIDPIDTICKQVMVDGDPEIFLDLMFDAFVRCHMNCWSSLRVRTVLKPFNSVSIPILRMAGASGKKVPRIVVEVDSRYRHALTEDEWRAVGEHLDLTESSCTDLTVKMGPAGIRRVRAPWSSLSSLTIRPSDDSDLLAWDALDILFMAPGLLQCTVELSRQPSSSYHTKILLRQLQSLTIRSDCPPMQFPSALDLPSITHFSVTPICFHEPQDESCSAVVEVARQYGAQLVDVAFDYRLLTQTALVYVLSHLPNVESLRLTTFNRPVVRSHNFALHGALEGWFPSTLEPLLHRFTLTSEESRSASQEECFCPKLKKLVCSLFEVTERVEEDILSLFKSRRGGEAMASAGERLDYLCLQFEKGSVEGLRDKVQRLGTSPGCIELTVRRN